MFQAHVIQMRCMMPVSEKPVGPVGTHPLSVTSPEERYLAMASHGLKSQVGSLGA